MSVMLYLTQYDSLNTYATVCKQIRPTLAEALKVLILVSLLFSAELQALRQLCECVFQIIYMYFIIIYISKYDYA